MANLTGFDPSLVRNSMNSFIAAADKIMDVLCHEFKTKFVDKMGDLWACKTAQDYFSTGVKPAMDSLTKDVDKILTSVVKSMTDAGNNWANRTGATFSAPTYESGRSKLNVESIKENINGVRGIDLTAATEASTALTSLATHAEAALVQAVSAVNNCGFIGGESAANLNSSLNKIKGNINTTFTNCQNQLHTAITKTVESYGDTEGKIATAFAGGE